MSTYLGVDVITMPSTPASPASIEFFLIDIVALSKSPFTGQQQVQDWNASYMKASVSMPPLTDTQAQDWIAFFVAMKGIKNVTQFTSAFAAAYPASLKTGSPLAQRYWRLESNERKWSISEARVYGFQFNLIEAI